MKFIIRRMTVEDVPVVAQLDRMAFSLSWPEHAFYYEVKENIAARCFVAETEDKQIVGMWFRG